MSNGPLSLRAHGGWDPLITLPFVAGFSDHGGATRFFVIAGVLELGTALMTRWDERQEVRAAGSTRATPARPR